MTRKKVAAEFFGTFCLVFAGTGAIVANEASGGAVSHVGVALAFGLVVLAMIYALGEVSGAHLNPAVTLGFWAARRLPRSELAPYIAAQCAGALAGSLSVRLLFPFGTAGGTASSTTVGTTLGATSFVGAPWQGFGLEAILTAVLMFVILSVSTGAKEKGITAGLVVGGVIALEALFAGPISGASMNPARSLGPALVGMQFAGLWVYLAAPILGALLGVGACRAIREEGCCG